MQVGLAAFLTLHHQPHTHDACKYIYKLSQQTPTSNEIASVVAASSAATSPAAAAADASRSASADLNASTGRAPKRRGRRGGEGRGWHTLEGSGEAK
jgi:hypothetical protein